MRLATDAVRDILGTRRILAFGRELCQSGQMFCTRRDCHELLHENCS
jgi:hypothetical protein